MMWLLNWPSLTKIKSQQQMFLFQGKNCSNPAFRLSVLVVNRYENKENTWYKEQKTNLQIWHIIIKPRVSWHTGHLVVFLLGAWLILQGKLLYSFSIKYTATAFAMQHALFYN
jgi:hypothetical protein